MLLRANRYKCSEARLRPKVQQLILGGKEHIARPAPQRDLLIHHALSGLKSHSCDCISVDSTPSSHETRGFHLEAHHPVSTLGQGCGVSSSIVSPWYVDQRPEKGVSKASALEPRHTGGGGQATPRARRTLYSQNPRRDVAPHDPQAQAQAPVFAHTRRRATSPRHRRDEALYTPRAHRMAPSTQPWAARTP